MAGVPWSKRLRPAMVLGLILILPVSACTQTKTASTDGAKSQEDADKTGASIMPDEVVSSFMAALATGSDEAVATYGADSLTIAVVDPLLEAFPTLAEEQTWAIEPGETGTWFCVSEQGNLAARLKVVGAEDPRVSEMDVVEIVGSAATAREDIEGLMMDVYDNQGNVTQEPIDWLSVQEGQHRLAVRIRTNDSSIVADSAGDDATSFDITGAGYDFVSIAEDGEIIADSAYSVGTGEDAGVVMEVEYYFAVPDDKTQGLSVGIEGYPDLALD